MDFSGIQKGVKDVWEFLWPSVVLLLLLGGIAFFLARETFADLIQWFFSSQSTIWNNRSFYKNLKRFELLKLIPLIALFLIIFVLYITQESIPRIGEILPGAITYRPGPLLAHSANDDDLARVWALFPTISNLDYLEEAINQRLPARTPESSSAPALSNLDFWSDEYNHAIRSFNIVKTLVLWLIICAILGVVKSKRFARTISRFFICFFILCIAGAHFTAKQVYAIEQMGYAEAGAAQVLIVPSVSNATPITEEQITQSKERVETWRREHTDSANPWWEFRLFQSNYFKWLKQTLLGSKP
jgi:hypothetical protein